MAATGTTLDPSDALRVAVRELYDELRNLVDTADPADPSLLDKMRKLSSTVGRKITTARKRAEAGDHEARPAQDEPAAAARPAAAPVVTPALPAQPESPAPVSHGRHRRQPRMPRWLFLVLAAVLAVAGSGMAVVVGSPLPLIAAAPAVGALHAWRECRLAGRPAGAR